MNFYNLYAVGTFTSGTLQTDGSIIIPNQTFSNGQISGTATVSSGKVLVTYTVTVSGASDDCTWIQN